MKLFIGDIIQKLRKIKGLTQEQVANALGITTSSVSKWETNNTLHLLLNGFLPIATIFLYFTIHYK